ncbi:hypothetical protein, partial [Commensalibacter sp. Nvir]|uniref:hypothetical protein n=1 Tax=Commensalibacter sp. Nvir TaxID=3069817 RepID=UPI0030C8805C
MRKKSVSVVFVWVPSHSGIMGNEKADQAAHLARKGELPSITTINDITVEDWIHEARKKLLKNWESQWKIQRAKLAEIKTACNTWTTSFRRSRREEIILCRMRIGHCLFTNGYLLRGLEAPTCENCDNTPQSVKHLLLECPLYKKERQKLKLSTT